MLIFLSLLKILFRGGLIGVIGGEVGQALRVGGGGLSDGICGGGLGHAAGVGDERGSDCGRPLGFGLIEGDEPPFERGGFVLFLQPPELDSGANPGAVR